MVKLITVDAATLSRYVNSTKHAKDNDVVSQFRNKLEAIKQYSKDKYGVEPDFILKV